MPKLRKMESALEYLLLRIIRHWTPAAVMRLLLRNGWLVKPGWKLREPLTAIADYKNALASAVSGAAQSLSGKTHCLLAMGVTSPWAVCFCDAGAEHVILCDRYAPQTTRPTPCYYLNTKNICFAQATPCCLAPILSLLQDDIRNINISDPGDQAPGRSGPYFEACDLVLSRSVYEHLDNVESLTPRWYA